VCVCTGPAAHDRFRVTYVVMNGHVCLINVHVCVCACVCVDVGVGFIPYSDIVFHNACKDTPLSIALLHITRLKDGLRRDGGVHHYITIMIIIVMRFIILIIRRLKDGLLAYAPVAPTAECVEAVRRLEAQYGEIYIYIYIYILDR
jgi:hypothetical protein